MRTTRTPQVRLPVPYQIVHHLVDMTAPSLSKLILPASLLAGGIFSSLTFPLAMFGSDPMVVHLKEEPVFVGQLKDVAAPYVGLAGLISLGTGAVGVTLAGWSQSSRKSEKIQEKLSGLQQQLREKEAQLEEVLLSQSRLEEEGLVDFIPETKPAVAKTASTKVPSQQSTTVQRTTWNVEPQEPTSSSSATAQAVAPLAAAQAFLSYTRSSTSTGTANSSETLAEFAPANSDIQELQEQLKQILQRMETLQGAAKAEPQQAPHPASHAKNAVASLDNHQRYQVESNWSMQKVAS